MAKSIEFKKGSEILSPLKIADFTATLAPSEFVAPFTHYVSVPTNISQSRVISAYILDMASQTSSAPMCLKVNTSTIIVYGNKEREFTVRVCYI